MSSVSTESLGRWANKNLLRSLWTSKVTGEDFCLSNGPRNRWKRMTFARPNGGVGFCGFLREAHEYIHPIMRHFLHFLRKNRGCPHYNAMNPRSRTLLVMSFGVIFWSCLLVMSFGHVFWSRLLVMAFGNAFWSCLLVLSFDRVFWPCPLVTSWTNVAQKSVAIGRL